MNSAVGPHHQMTLEVLGACDLTISRTVLSSINLVSRWSGRSIARIRVTDSVISGKIQPTIDLLALTKWDANGNRYRLERLSISGEQFGRAQWEEYRKKYGQDADSVWEAGSQQP